MGEFVKRLLLAALLAFSVLAGHAQDRVQLKEFRSRFVGQRVVINPDFSSVQMPFLASWHFVQVKKGIYRIEYARDVPASFAGRTGVIIAVQAPQPVSGPSPAQTDDTYVAFGNAIIKLDSGEVLLTTLSGAALRHEPGSEPSDTFTMASLRERHQQEADALARKLKGKSVYLTRMNRVFDLGLKTTEVQAIRAGVGYSKAEIFNFPLLTPLPVLQTRYSAARNYMLVVIQLPEGRKAIYVPGCVDDTPSAQKYDCAMTAMPSFLGAKEVDAIRKGKVFVGMSEPAVYMAMGRPKHTNKSAGGLTQLIYRSAYVYLDGSHKVAGIQKQN